MRKTPGTSCCRTASATRLPKQTSVERPDAAYLTAAAGTVFEVNPALAAHGGYAKLEGVQDDVAFVTMGGGCQGCAVSAVTLREGIEAAILEAIPEITRVEDATDHTAGANPFY